MVVFGKDDISYLLSPQSIRDRSIDLLNFTESGKGLFTIDWDAMPALASYTSKVIRENYPHLNVPYHSRWRHFQRPNYDRVAKLKDRIRDYSAADKVYTLFDLVIVSVLLDAGAGPDWKYKDPFTGDFVGRSEGLGLASFDMFVSGLFSGTSDLPLCAHADQLEKLSLEQLQQGFQISSSNPMVGLEGRLQVLKNLGKHLKSLSDAKASARPGHIFDRMKVHAEGNELDAQKMLSVLLETLNPIWPSRIEIHGKALGDVWHHTGLGSIKTPQSLVPFHKLTQWLCFSLLDPVEEGGIKAVNVEALTALAEYRNGGLFLDAKVLVPKDGTFFRQAYTVESHTVIEWRALTIALVDKLAPMIRRELGVGEEFSVPKILEGGTWWAGRKLAYEARPNGEPPINVVRDGTVF
jgi:hypothetical protein